MKTIKRITESKTNLRQFIFLTALAGITMLLLINGSLN